jgi:hypothetical protein
MKEVHNLYCSPCVRLIGVTKLGKILWAVHVPSMERVENAYKNLVGKPEGKKPFGRTRCRWETNIKIDVREKGSESADWSYLAQDTDLKR